MSNISNTDLYFKYSKKHDFLVVKSSIFNCYLLKKIILIYIGVVFLEQCPLKSDTLWVCLPMWKYMIQYIFFHSLSIIQGAISTVGS